MKLFVFGSAGQLGHEILKRMDRTDLSAATADIKEVDITRSDQVFAAVRRECPDVIVNCAAFTDVDRAEAESSRAYAVNCEGTGNLAVAAREIGARFLHVSTDFVFDGHASSPISELAATNPVSVYGASKLAGEKRALEIYPEKTLVVRTSSLHGRGGPNFVHTMIKLFSEKEQVRVVSDRRMTATWAGWLAEVLLELAARREAGIVNAACSGVLSWYEFAQEILALVKGQIPNAARLRLEAVPGETFKLAAPRPAYSALDCARLTALLGRPPITWQEGLRRHLSDLGYFSGGQQ